MCRILLVTHEADRFDMFSEEIKHEEQNLESRDTANPLDLEQSLNYFHARWLIRTSKDPIDIVFVDPVQRMCTGQSVVDDLSEEFPDVEIHIINGNVAEVLKAVHS